MNYIDRNECFRKKYPFRYAYIYGTLKCNNCNRYLKPDFLLEFGKNDCNIPQFCDLCINQINEWKINDR
jgi:hypothetical protein